MGTDLASKPSPYLLADAVSGRCLGCHSKIAGQLGSTVRHPAAFRPQGCTLCHSPHASAWPGLLKEEQQPLCLACHGIDDYRRSAPLRNIREELAGQPYQHGPVADGDCAACHNPHGSSYFRLLTGPYPRDLYTEFTPGTYGFCFGCHSPELLTSDSAQTRFRDGDRNLHFLHVVEPRKGRSCRACHAPHAATNRQLIRSEGATFGQWQIPVNFGVAASGGRCSPGCHQEKSYDRTRRQELDLSDENGRGGQ